MGQTIHTDYLNEPEWVDLRRPVLFDDCERCAQHAVTPFDSMDDTSFAELVKQYDEGALQHGTLVTDTELKAMTVIHFVELAHKRTTKARATNEGN